MIDIDAVKAYLQGLQDKICEDLSKLDGGANFEEESWVREEGGGGRSRVMTDGNKSTRTDYSYECEIFCSSKGRRRTDLVVWWWV